MKTGAALRILVPLAALFLSACASAPSCPPGLAAGSAIDLYFGRGVPGGREVTDAQWRDFVDQVLIREFPDGSTTFDASGTWFSTRQNRTISERSAMVSVIVPDARQAAPKVERLIAEYKARFAQDSVLRAERAVCFAF
ncbi:MAG: DUF3574 domain-containing protein [Alphaproteobacteria bacterium]|nr:DUF3574 domain-containing protein [Alphaproteobacteria bacterium]MCA0449546.1 DUF3574 domain-containing protein [Pseudomonadota bacterium]